MIKLISQSVRYSNGQFEPCGGDIGTDSIGAGTMTYDILAAHNVRGAANAVDAKICRGDALNIKFDALTSHDITYVGIIQTARGSGLNEFPVPYVLTNCHNSLCAVGGTINEDDHIFGLSAAQKYGGIFVPAHIAVIHQYMREMHAGCGKMILGSDSHTRYGAIGTLAIGEGGPELVKQLVKKTYDIAAPDVVAVRLFGAVQPGVGPHDVALALIKAVFANGFVKNAALEFILDKTAKLSMDFRNGIDVMTTETACLTSIWQTDEVTHEYLKMHGRAGDFRALSPQNGAVYSAAIELDLSKIEPMIALPFHPSNAFTIREFLANAGDILASVDGQARKLADNPAPILAKLRGGKVYADQGIIAGCAGGMFENIVAADGILGRNMQMTLPLSIYPASQPILSVLTKNGVAARLIDRGVILRSAFCGPCFGAGDVPGNGELSIRHSTRNFPNREGAQPKHGQMAYTALMDARSIAATAINGGAIVGATDFEQRETYAFSDAAYSARVYNGWGNAKPEIELKRGPNIVDWPKIPPLPDHLVMEIASALYDEVTTTDELIPSGETSSYRSNPMRLAEFTLSRRDPGYVARARVISQTGKGSAVFALQPGDGSAREQAASCQRVLGGCANIAEQYATRRYRANLVNWGMLPFILDNARQFGIAVGDVIRVDDIRAGINNGAEVFPAYIAKPDGTKTAITLKLPDLTRGERDIILAGCLMNYYAGE